MTFQERVSSIAHDVAMQLLTREVKDREGPDENDIEKVVFGLVTDPVFMDDVVDEVIKLLPPDCCVLTNKLWRVAVTSPCFMGSGYV